MSSISPFCNGNHKHIAQEYESLQQTFRATRKDFLKQRKHYFQQKNNPCQYLSGDDLMSGEQDCCKNGSKRSYQVAQKAVLQNIGSLMHTTTCQKETKKGKMSHCICSLCQRFENSVHSMSCANYNCKWLRRKDSIYFSDQRNQIVQCRTIQENSLSQNKQSPKQQNQPPVNFQESDQAKFSPKKILSDGTEQENLQKSQELYLKNQDNFSENGDRKEEDDYEIKKNAREIPAEQFEAQDQKEIVGEFLKKKSLRKGLEEQQQNEIVGEFSMKGSQRRSSEEENYEVVGELSVEDFQRTGSDESESQLDLDAEGVSQANLSNVLTEQDLIEASLENERQLNFRQSKERGVRNLLKMEQNLNVEREHMGYEQQVIKEEQCENSSFQASQGYDERNQQPQAEESHSERNTQSFLDLKISGKAYNEPENFSDQNSLREAKRKQIESPQIMLREQQESSTKKFCSKELAIEEQPQEKNPNEGWDTSKLPIEQAKQNISLSSGLQSPQTNISLMRNVELEDISSINNLEKERIDFFQKPIQESEKKCELQSKFSQIAMPNLNLQQQRGSNQKDKLVTQQSDPIKNYFCKQGESLDLEDQKRLLSRIKNPADMIQLKKVQNLSKNTAHHKEQPIESLESSFQEDNFSFQSSSHKPDVIQSTKNDVYTDIVHENISEKDVIDKGHTQEKIASIATEAEKGNVKESKFVDLSISAEYIAQNKIETEERILSRSTSEKVYSEEIRMDGGAQSKGKTVTKRKIKSIRPQLTKRYQNQHGK